jgi:hypothetical protein
MNLNPVHAGLAMKQANQSLAGTITRNAHSALTENDTHRAASW